MVIKSNILNNFQQSVQPLQKTQKYSSIPFSYSSQLKSPSNPFRFTSEREIPR